MPSHDATLSSPTVHRKTGTNASLQKAFAMRGQHLKWAERIDCFEFAAGIAKALLRLKIVCRHLPERRIEYSDIVLHAKPDVGVLIERTVAGKLPVCRVKLDRLVAVLLRELDAALEIGVFDIAQSPRGLCSLA